jgi:predicted acetyltransferase
MTIRLITLESVKPYILETKKEGMAGYSRFAAYYGAFEGDELVGFTSIQKFGNKAKFNNHYIFPQHRGKGYFKQLLDFSLDKVKSLGFTEVVAACTKMSIKEYLKRGATVEKEFKICTNVKLKI